jgi:predicted transcriptional regulator
VININLKELATIMAVNLPISTEDAMYVLNKILQNPFDLDVEINTRKYLKEKLDQTQNQLEIYGNLLSEDRNKYMNKIKFYQGERSAYEKILNYYDSKLNEGE